MEITDPAVVTRKKQIANGHHLDLEVLMFKDFNNITDAGIYMCGRKHDIDGFTNSRTLAVKQKRKYGIFYS